ncbi:MAG: glycine zipper domain-containing protein [Pseudomonadota bacterium]|uniref:glycine zipper domain-containing protein n=1 Tax=Thermithiobacillus tepidarius TaxID=929 RepID=UPI0004265060|nr:glycine zipper domain-containing protein [Thermithiobacillus tepidarius]
MNRNNVKHSLLAVVAVAALGGCASNGYDWRNPTISGSHAYGEAATGAAIGGVAGAVIGEAVGGNATTGAVTGAAIGGAGGYIHGREKDQKK